MSRRWIKMTTDLPNNPAVLSMAVAVKKDPLDICGRLLLIWGIADSHADEDRDGLMVGSPDIVDKAVRCKGFSAAMEAVGWIKFEGEHMSFPGYIEHNGNTAKLRAQSQKRNAKKRKRDADITQPLRKERNISVTREEKRREEKNNTNTEARAQPPEIEFPDDIPEQIQELVKTWNAIEHTINVRQPTALMEASYLHLWKSRGKAQIDEAIEKVRNAYWKDDDGWKPDLTWFLREENFEKVVTGRYDHKAGKGGKREMTEEEMKADILRRVRGS